MGRRKQTTAFPTARIKKIMQQDDEVGKIATNTPALVGKALECLMEDLLRDSANIAIGKRAKTLTPSHLKASISARVQFDFLRPLLANVPDITENNVDMGVEGPSKPKRPRAVTPLNTNAPIVVKKRKPAASPVAVASVAQSYHHEVSLPTIPDRLRRDDDDEDYDEDEEMPPNNESKRMSSPVASSFDMPETPVVIRDFGVVRPVQQRKENTDSNPPSSCSRVSVHALLS